MAGAPLSAQDSCDGSRLASAMLSSATMRGSRLVSCVSAAVVGAALSITACQGPTDEQNALDGALNEVSKRPSLPVAEPPMDRRTLLEAVARAASATALGQDDANAQRRLDGKRFEVRIRFGCATGVQSPPDGDAPFKVRFDEEDRTLRVRAAPDLTRKDPAVAPLASQSIESVEGFWMRRPWLLADGCPVSSSSRRPAEGEPATDVPPLQDVERGTAGDVARPAAYRLRVGIAQFFTEANSRTGRREERAYETSKVLAESEQPSAEGYNLVLSGRLRRLSGGRVISCRLANADAPPECVVSAEFDRVRIEVPSTKYVLAEWSN